MIQGVVNQPVEEHFTVADAAGNLVPGIDSTEFSVYVYNPLSVEVAVAVDGSIVELGNGNYKYIFTPNLTGTWYVAMVHPTYFPWAKTNDVQVYKADLSIISDDIKRTLGLVHHNFHIDQTQYDEHGNMIGARVRIYSDSASVGTNSNVIETYKIESDAEACGQFTYWQQKTF